VALLEAVARKLPIGIVTGRPRADAVRFLERHGIAGMVSALVCMEDAPLKPDPAPVRLALDRLGVRRAWMVGDSPDDMTAARAAGVVPIGIVAPGDRLDAVAPALFGAGAARVLEELRTLEDLLP
jgi:phosphoglycolate phosphatase-like HAD superfamily hydrolase